jgi:hypothetical protein
MNAASRIALEALYCAILFSLGEVRALDSGLYRQLQSTAVQLARVLEKPCPIVTRQERRDLRTP